MHEIGNKMFYNVLATYKYPEYDSYTGPSERAEFKFRAVKGTKLIVKWLLEELIPAKARLADVYPLYATLKVRHIKEDFLDYISDDYHLILYFHDSPAVASIILAIAAAITAAGFLVLAWNSTPDTWEAIAKVPEGIAKIPTGFAEIPKQTATMFLVAGLGVIAFLAFKSKEY